MTHAASTTRWGLMPRQIRQLLGHQHPLPWPAHLLVLGHGSVGDTIVSLALLRCIRSKAPDTQVAWVAPAALEPVLSAVGVDEFIEDNDAEPARPIDMSRFGAVIVLEDVGASRYAHLGSVESIPHRIGATNGKKRAAWCNHLVHIKRFGLPRHEVQRNLRLLLPFGVDDTLTLSALPPMVAMAPFVGEIPMDLPLQRYIALHPFSAGHAREWPKEHWSALALELRARGWSVLFTGSFNEGERMAKAWPKHLRPPGVFEAFGRLDLGQLGIILSRADGLVAASTGPLHFGAALGRPSLGLFAPRKGIDLSRWAPIGLRAEGIQSRARCMRRCTAEYCRCIIELNPLNVAERIDIMANKTATS